MRSLVLVATLVGCANATHLEDPQPDAPPVAERCAGALAANLAIEGGALVARCTGIEIHATPLADGVIELRYAATGVAEPASWAVLAKPPDPDARIGGSGVCTAQLAVAIDAQCEVHATLADGTPILDDAVPFDGAGTLVRTARTDRVYGLGERTGGLDRRGHTWTFWNTDAYDPAFGGWHPGQDPMYQAIPFELHAGAGGAFGLFTDETRRMTIELGGAHDTTSAATTSLAQYVIAGPRLADVVRRYTTLTGAPALPPRWAFGFHQSRWGYTNATQLLAIADRFRSEGIPADALWLDIQAQNGFRSFTFDETNFPAALIGQLAAKGFHVVAIEDPGIKAEAGYPVYDSGIAGGHFLSYQGTAWPGAAVWPDVSRPETRAWWGQQVSHIADRGIAG
ncbi:MAG TPA: TIM-barrel domain-containing protein, partial [Kofleriaceae bacterium]|nr:TIM-barrel domain-containing protein [Kofleriaceae bacterium]